MNGMDVKISANRSQVELHSTTSMRSQTFDYRHRLALARIAIRLHRYCAENGVFPKDLAEIVDTSLPNLPINLWDDQPVRYQSMQRAVESLWSQIQVPIPRLFPSQFR